MSFRGPQTLKDRREERLAAAFRTGQEGGLGLVEYAFDRLTEILPKMVNITGNEVRGSRRYRC
jgi:hypothetical protein